MNKYGRGIVSGFAATAVLSAFMVLKMMMGFMPEVNIIAMLDGMVEEQMGVVGLPMGWIIHFLIGSALFGTAFVVVHDKLPGVIDVKKGIWFALLAWLVMMVAVLPMAGAGFFGLGLGFMVPIMTFMLHVIFGAVLGFTYNKLG